MEFKELERFPDYEIYEDGTVWRKEHTTIHGANLKRMQVSPTMHKSRYLVVSLHDRQGRIHQFYLHRLVYEAFGGEIPPKMQIDHLDCDRMNCSYQNLRLCTQKSNSNNPRSIENYKRANALSAGKFNKSKMIESRGKKRYEQLKQLYLELYNKHGKVGIWLMMNVGHCGYPRACKVVAEMEEKLGLN